jgi:exopolyphosphatase/guanosine-5'-triphosphate,3'-diphosphate pyrophosphatase
LTSQPPEIVAAVDLGSNSFHMIVCRLKDGKLHTIDRLREMVRLGSGLNQDNFISQETQDRALACLERFGQRIRNFPTGTVRAVGTNTLRTAKNSNQFLLRAEAALGQPIHIISGIEEARLIYQGVAHSLASNANKRLVMDIGGGSTEYIIGKLNQARRKESLHMGCVSLSNKFFPNGIISSKKFRQAVLFAERELEPFQYAFSHKRWDEAIGASGTLRAVNKILQASEWSNNGITLAGLEKLVDAITKAEHVNDLDLPGLDPERAPVFPGGVAIIYASFLRLGIEQMTISDGALREGLVHDLLGRIFNNDIRSETVLTTVDHYHVDKKHNSRIKQAVHYMLAQLNNCQTVGETESRQLLDWAADLHEIGHEIAHSQYHKHSAYIIKHSDLAGFSQQDQLLLSTIIRAHRRKLPIKFFKELPKPWNKTIVYLVIVLRMAILLHRNRHDFELPDYKITLKDKKITLNFPDKWLQKSPLTHADLMQEAEYLNAADFTLEFR